MQIQHFYANSPAFPSNMYHRAAKKYDMVYHHQVMVSPRSQDLVLNHQSVLVSVDNALPAQAHSANNALNLKVMCDRCTLVMH